LSVHEPTIAAALISLAQEEAARAGHPGAAITSVTVRVGALRAVVEESLRLAFDVLKANTPLENAELIIQGSPVRGTCRHCGAPFEPPEAIFLCSACGSGDVALAGGDELDLVTMIIEGE